MCKVQFEVQQDFARPVYGEGGPRPEGVVGGGTQVEDDLRRVRVLCLLSSPPSHHRFAAVPPPRKRGGRNLSRLRGGQP